MRRTARLLLALGVLGTSLLTSTAIALAGSSVDPSLLQPPPPPGASCSQNGPWVTCTTTFDGSVLNEPQFELPCGVVYATSTDVRAGRRWYSDGKLVRRHVVQDAAGTWSLSPSGTGPVVSVVSHATWGEVYTIPGDESSAVGHVRGTELLAKSADGKVVAHISGRTNAEGDFTGLFLPPDDPRVAGTLCDALGD